MAWQVDRAQRMIFDPEAGLELRVSYTRDVTSFAIWRGDDMVIAFQGTMELLEEFVPPLIDPRGRLLAARVRWLVSWDASIRGFDTSRRRIIKEALKAFEIISGFASTWEGQLTHADVEVAFEHDPQPALVHPDRRSLTDGPKPAR